MNQYPFPMFLRGQRMIGGISLNIWQTMSMKPPQAFLQWEVFECWFNLITLQSFFMIHSWKAFCLWVFVHSSRLSNLLMSCSYFSFIIFYLSAELAVVTLLSFLILVIYVLLFLINLVKVLLAFVDLFEEPTFGFPDFSLLFFYSLFCLSLL